MTAYVSLGEAMLKAYSGVTLLNIALLFGTDSSAIENRWVCFNTKN